MRISVAEACQRLQGGGVVAIPTETVYGLAAKMEVPEAIEQVFALKKRPSDNPLIIHLPDSQALDIYVENMPEEIDLLIDAFWPGPLTVILKAIEYRVPAIARAHLPTAAFRIPRHPIAREIVRQVGPLVAPSANLSGRPSATSPEHVEEDFGRDFPVVDGGECQEGVESTIIAFHQGRWQIARLGAITADELKGVLGYLPEVIEKQNRPLCPGNHYRHYAPEATLLLGTVAYQGQGDVVVGYSDRSYPGAHEVILLGSSKNEHEVAHNLYQVLRSLDEKHIKAAWVDLYNLPTGGLWPTIRERLERASKN